MKLLVKLSNISKSFNFKGLKKLHEINVFKERNQRQKTIIWEFNLFQRYVFNDRRTEVQPPIFHVRLSEKEQSDFTWNQFQQTVAWNWRFRGDPRLHASLKFVRESSRPTVKAFKIGGRRRYTWAVLRPFLALPAKSRRSLEHILVEIFRQIKVLQWTKHPAKSWAHFDGKISSNQSVWVDQIHGEVLSTLWWKYSVKSKFFSGPKSRQSRFLSTSTFWGKNFVKSRVKV